MNRRGFLLGALAAPVVVTTPGLLMPVRSLVDRYEDSDWVYDAHRNYYRVNGQARTWAQFMEYQNTQPYPVVEVSGNCRAWKCSEGLFFDSTRGGQLQLIPQPAPKTPEFAMADSYWSPDMV